MTPPIRQETQKGLFYALGCYLFWGGFPIFWYPLYQSAMPATQIMAHRVLWSAVFAALLLIWFKKGAAIWQIFRQPKLLLCFVVSALLIGANWLIYLWAIVNNRVLDASLGYFINPLFNVLLGFIFFRERLNRWQLLAIVLASIGIAWLTIPMQQIPWVALLLAGSFGIYGLVRKLVPIEALVGITLETFILLPLALAYLIWCALNNTLIFSELSTLQTTILLTSGAATTIPLLLFTAGAQRISLSLLGILQYLSPSLQLLCGILLFNEALNGARLNAYMWVWAGLLVFLIGTWYKRKN